MNRQYAELPVYPQSASFGGEGEGTIGKTVRVEVEPTVNVTEEDLRAGKISVIDAVQILVSANAVNGVKAERETARVLALTKVRSELTALGADAFFAGITLDPEDLITLYAKIMRPRLGDLAVYETAIKKMRGDQTFLRQEFVRVINSKPSAQ